jgi:hypothetical protein
MNGKGKGLTAGTDNSYGTRLNPGTSGTSGLSGG